MSSERLSPPPATIATVPAIRVRGARVHNLQSVDVDIPRDRLVVISGVSGSGKSSLAFSTLFAEGQRRYLESLSAYTRQFLDQLERPDVDELDGLPPTLSIEQRVGAVQPRSTLATTTEIHDFLRLLYARAGVVHCPQCGQPVSQQSVGDILESILALEAGRKVMILAPLVRGRKGTHRELFEKICREGFVRARVDGEIVDAASPPELKKSKVHDIEVVIDRIVVKEGLRPRLHESIELALKHGEGTCLVSHQSGETWQDHLFSSRFACPTCEISLPPIEPRTFSFNSPYGACPKCEGLGFVSLAEEDEATAVCPECHVARLNPIARAVTVGDLAIHQFTAMTVADAQETAARWQTSLSSASADVLFHGAGGLVAEKVLPDLTVRLQFLRKVGLDYLTLDRPTRTLSGGEFQRARLAGCLGTGLIGACYILDEPTIGLHPRDTQRLLSALEELRDAGNSVIVVEHDIEIIRAADCLIDLGPGAGKEGGRIVAQGTPAEVAENENSVTGRFLRGSPSVLTGRQPRPVVAGRALTLQHVSIHNLYDVSATFPLGVFVCVTGVSGSGKTSLVLDTLVPRVRPELARRDFRSTDHTSIDLPGVEQIDRLIEIDQSPIGRSGRSNPATASGMWDEIRRVFARTREARLRGYRAGRFSFNGPGGRCEECRGQGVRRVRMHFLPDLDIVCPVCRGTRFNRQTLQIRFRGHSIADVLNLRIDAAAEFFENFAALKQTFATFVEVGLGYLTLGQSALTLSGGEAQRIKLATELSRPAQGKTLFVLDEPTTGLHPADIDRLLKILQRLVDQGHSVLVIEHQLDVIAAADWIIDMGPEGGAGGGKIVTAGTPAQVASIAASHTGRALLEDRNRFFS